MRIQFFLVSVLMAALLEDSVNGAFISPKSTATTGSHAASIPQMMNQDHNDCIYNEKLSRISTAQRQHRRAFLTASLAVCWTPLLAFGGDEERTTTFHIVDYPKQGSCGEADVPESGVFFVKQFGGMVEGSCAAEGYTVDEGTAPGIKEKDQKRTYKIYGK